MRLLAIVSPSNILITVVIMNRSKRISLNLLLILSVSMIVDVR